MRTLALLLIGFLVWSCARDKPKNSNSESSQLETIPKDDPFNNTGVLLFDASLMNGDYKTVASANLYSNLELTELKDSLYFLFHHYKAPGFSIDNHMCEKRDLFTYFLDGQRHYGLIYSASIDSAYHILKYTNGGSWIDKNEMPEHWVATSWDSLSSFLALEDKLLQPSKSNIVFTDRDLQNPAKERFKSNHYGRIAYFSDTLIGVIKEDIRYEQINFGGYEKKTIKSEDTIWLPFRDQNGRLNVDFVQELPDWGLYNRGTGVLAGDFNTSNRFANKKFVPAKDSIPLYGNNKRKPIGAIPLYGDAPYMYGTYIEGKDTTYMLRWTGNYEWFAGLTSIEGMRVYDENGKYIKLIKERYLGQDIWLDVNDLSEEYEYLSWKKYFKRFPKGNLGWTSGYAWVGKPDYVYAEPNERSAKVLELPSMVEIYLTGKTEGNWAEVKVKEVDHVFGEMYFSHAAYFHTFNGWVKMTNDKGWPNLDEIILGC